MRFRLTCFTVFCCLAARGENGIDVGKPKVYDNRSLLIMLDELKSRLNSTQFVDPKALADALGMQQGYESQDVATEFSASASMNPAASGGTTASSGSSGAASLPELPTAPAYTPKFGENPSDLLADQVNLTYQVFNLKLLLERSLTDRLQGDKTRLQAVLGFNVSLAPPLYAKDCAAFVEVTLSSANGGEPPSLVAVMPQEKTYNSSALSQHATAFGGSAVARMFSVGFTERRRGQTFYLFRDADIVSFERMSRAGAQTAEFGWQFRPVLGRRSVSPGMRQLFAVVSLPAVDELKSKDPSYVNVTVKTYWRRYDHRTLTTYKDPWFFSSAFWSTLFGPPLPGHEDVRTAENLPIYTTVTSQRDLTPCVEDVTWSSVGDGKAVVLVTGKNFFPGTTAVVGGKTLGESSGLILKSDQAMQINTDTAALAAGDAVLNGRYGPSIRLEPTSRRFAFSISGVNVAPMGEQFYRLTARLSGIALDDIPPNSPPVIALNGVPVQTLPSFYCPPDSQPSCEQLAMDIAVPASMLKTVDGILLLKFPFRGGGSATFPIYEPCHQKVERVGGGDITTLVINTPTDCSGANWLVQLDKTYKADVLNSDLLRLRVPSAALKNYKDLLLSFDVVDKQGKRRWTLTKLLPIPSAAAAPAPEPKLDAGQSDGKPGVNSTRSIARGDSYGVVFTGTDLGGIKYAEFNGERLQSENGEGGKKLTVYITPAITKEAGRKDILLYTASGHVIAAPLVVTPGAIPAGGSEAKLNHKSRAKGRTNP